jgi:DNA polymerase V
MILHIDCNSFYASCEQAFRPDLRGKPVVVLSNNDGIIVALTKQAKAIGIKRGDALFEITNLIESNNVAIFSSNYTLYADMSQRIHEILISLCPDVEVYSIDESFLFFPDLTNIKDIAATIKETVECSTGIPVSIGIAPTKTLAKLANKLAKKRTGILDIRELDLDEELKQIPVNDVWGIGFRYATLLTAKGVKTAYDLKHYPLHKAKKDLTIRGYYTVQELNGIPLIDELVPKAKKNIISSRGFSHLVEDQQSLEEAAADYTLEAVMKMRKQHSATKALGVAVMTNRFREDLPQYTNSIVYQVNPPSSYAPELVKLAIRGLCEIYKPGYKYQKVMIYLLNLVHEDTQQLDFFAEDKTKQTALMKCFDEISQKYNSHTLFIGTRGIDRKWGMKRNFLSPSYTTSLADIPKVK